MTDRIFSAVIPVVLTAIIAFGAWLVSNSFRGESALTAADEVRITQGLRSYSDQHYRNLREDLAAIRAELARISDLQMQIVLQLKAENSGK